MKFLKYLFNLYINSSIHVALAVCSLVGITCLEFNIDFSKTLFGLVFFGSITGYNFVKNASNYRLRFNALNVNLKIIQIVSFFAMIFFAMQLSNSSLVVIGLFALLTFLYAIPILKNKNLRNFTGLKIAIVAVVWAGVTVLIPLINESVELDLDNWLSFIQRFLFVFVLTLPFEIRDLQIDDLTLGTLPQRVGIKKTKTIGVILLIVASLIELFKDDISLNYIVSFGIISLVLVLFLLNSEKKQSNYFSSFWVESIPILWFGIFSLFQFYFDIS